jgi:hypothetical protein
VVQEYLRLFKNDKREHYNQRGSCRCNKLFASRPGMWIVLICDQEDAFDGCLRGSVQLALKRNTDFEQVQLTRLAKPNYNS